MAKITINIPVDKEQWVLDGFVIRFGYQAQVSNPDFNPELSVDSKTNPQNIDNPETPTVFCKRMLIHIIKNEANTGHNNASNEANAVIANTIELT